MDRWTELHYKKLQFSDFFLSTIISIVLDFCVNFNSKICLNAVCEGRKANAILRK